MSILLGKGEKAGIGKLTCELTLSGFGRWNSKIAAVRFASRVVCRCEFPLNTDGTLHFSTSSGVASPKVFI